MLLTIFWGSVPKPEVFFFFTIKMEFVFLTFDFSSDVSAYYLRKTPVFLTGHSGNGYQYSLYMLLVYFFEKLAYFPVVITCKHLYFQQDFHVLVAGKYGNFFL